MAFATVILKSDGSQFTVPAEIGTVTFIVGANGTGKSSLMQRLYSQNGAACRWITAHRQTWLTSNALTMSPSDRINQGRSWSANDLADSARYQDYQAANRVNAAIYDLVDAENIRARAIATKVGEQNLEEARRLADVPAPIATINDLLAASGIPIALSLESNDRIVAKKSGGTPYSIAELSDGERNALLISAMILTAPAEALILVDEPERHLHRSIIRPFLVQLFARRADCAFIVSTHDIGLPLEHTNSQSVLVRTCTFEGSRVKSWDLDLLPPNREMDDSLKIAILGARRKVLFIEGDQRSLDFPMYSILFPDVSVIPVESCRSVDNHVRAIRDAAELHWMTAFGIVDGDQLDDATKREMLQRGIFALEFYSVEALYYHPKIQCMVAKRQANLMGGNAHDMLLAAKTAAISVVKPHVRRLAARMTEKVVRDKLMLHVPNWKNISSGCVVSVEIDSALLLDQEVDRLDGLIRMGDSEGIIKRYPIRETQMIEQIVSNLLFKNRGLYEAAVRKLVGENSEARSLILSFFGSLTEALRAD